MSKLDIALKQLISAILDSEEYQEYEKQCNRVNQNPELKAKIDEFRERNFLLQIGEDTAFDKVEQLEMEYSDFRENALVSDFLAAELAFCRMMQNINLRLMEEIHFE